MWEFGNKFPYRFPHTLNFCNDFFREIVSVSADHPLQRKEEDSRFQNMPLVPIPEYASGLDTRICLWSQYQNMPLIPIPEYASGPNPDN